jgi:hypothetical protein
MPQQINLCTPILLTQRRYFSAQTMVQALAFFVVLGGALCAYWVMSLRTSSAGFKQAVEAHAPELNALQSAIATGRAGGIPVDPGLTQELQVRRADLIQREKMLDELKAGLFREGWGQSARLQLVAQSIPAQVWVTAVKASDVQLDVSGFTLEPSALNEWVRKLAASPLLQGQRLATVKVERVVGDGAASVPPLAPSVPAAAATGVSAQRPLWSFGLTSALSPVDGAATKGKP